MNFENIFHSYSKSDFLTHALSLFRYQYHYNTLYRSYCDFLRIDQEKVTTLSMIPFLPISFFKAFPVKTGDFEPELEFWSSGTSGNEKSKHLVKSATLYECAFVHSFKYFYGNPSNYCFLTLLPNYLTQEHSSLVYMMSHFISNSKFEESGFYLHNHEELFNTIVQLKEKKRKTILFGVSFALLDFAAQYTFDFSDLMVFETGGMKGRRPEIVKEELHTILKNAFGVKQIYSEYGMCELLSQAYSNRENLFATPPWMKFLLRDEKDPLFHSETLRMGAINIIDFANVYSCAFLATDDIGKQATNGMIEILGRLDAAQIRGCNLIY